jgi:hypothetical protein
VAIDRGYQGLRHRDDVIDDVPSLLDDGAAGRGRVLPVGGGVAAWRLARETTTGGAVMRFDVNTPAAGTARPSSVATSARSDAPDPFTPAAAPAATNPAADVTLMLPLSDRLC